jgi:ribulose-phosphate 3-epimerase
MNHTIKIAPSVLTADFAYLGDTIKMLDESGADWIHCDVMDNAFVPNMSFGQSMIRAFRRLTDKPLDVHLMLLDSAKYIGEFADSGADIISIHVESPSSTHLQRVIQAIKKRGKKAGVALNPGTHPESVDYVLEDVDLVLVMSVNPGYGGQVFIPQTLRKIEHIAERIASLGVPVEIEVDGGVNLANYQAIRDAGASVLVAGHAVVDAENPAEVIAKLRS